MGIIEQLKAGDNLYGQRLEQIKNLRDAEGEVLRRFAPRKPAVRVYFSLPIAPIMVVLSPMLWFMDRENPIDGSTTRQLKVQADVDGEVRSVKLYSSSGNVVTANRMGFEISRLSRLEIIKRDFSGSLEAEISKYNPRYNFWRDNFWIVRSGDEWISRRPATLIELDVHRDLLIQVEQSLVATSPRPVIVH